MHKLKPCAASLFQDILFQFRIIIASGCIALCLLHYLHLPDLSRLDASLHECLLGYVYPRDSLLCAFLPIHGKLNTGVSDVRTNLFVVLHPRGKCLQLLASPKKGLLTAPPPPPRLPGSRRYAAANEVKNRLHVPSSRGNRRQRYLRTDEELSGGY